MTLIHAALFRTTLRLATFVTGAALLAACSDASTSPGSPTTVPSAAAAAGTPITASVAPSSVPTAAPSVAALPPMLGTGTAVACDPADTAKSCLAPGTYRLTGGPDAWPVMVTIDLPAGWFDPDGGPGWDLLLVQSGPDTHYAGTGWSVQFSTVGDVYRDPCDVSKGTIPAAQVDTPQKLAAAIAAWPGFTTTATQPTTVDGHSALEFKVAKKVNPGCGSGNAWLSASGTAVNAYPFASGPKYSTTFRVVGTGHGLLVIRAVDFPDTSPYEVSLGLPDTPTRHTADQVKLHEILDSIRITDWPTSA